MDAPKVEQPIQDVSPVRAWMVLMNIIIGIGMLSIPYCFRSGIITNTLILLVVGLAAFLSFVLLIDAALTGHVTIEYAKLIGQAFGQKLEWIPNLLIFSGFFGVGVLHLQYSYFMVLAVLQEVAVTVDLPSWAYNRPMWIFGLAVVVDLPLTFIKTISKFSKVSVATCFLIFLYLVHSAIYLGIGVHDSGFDPEHEVRYFELNNFFVTAIAVQAFAFNCHPTVGPTLARLINPTRSRQYRVLACVVIGAAVAYYIGGLLPYLTLRNRVSELIIFLCYPTGQIFTIITKGLYGVFLLITTPLILFSGRFCLAGLICRKEIPVWQWQLMGVIMLLCCAIMATWVESLEIMFDLIGGCTVPMITYLFPATFYIRICKGESKWKMFVAWGFLPFGMLNIALALYHSFANLL
jgi:sodium-coupled neutral amino acid transporter 10